MPAMGTSVSPPTQYFHYSQIRGGRDPKKFSKLLFGRLMFPLFFYSHDWKIDLARGLEHAEKFVFIHFRQNWLLYLCYMIRFPYFRVQEYLDMRYLLIQ